MITEQYKYEVQKMTCNIYVFILYFSCKIVESDWLKDI